MKGKPAYRDLLLILDINKTDSELKMNEGMLKYVTQRPTPTVNSFICCYRGLYVGVNILILSVSTESKIIKTTM